eukprot:TRINITY_DN2084_c0_g1_i1.p1 TRINITY_DN2084_c0_g1~~TRINITY_DN2084_c0_g1_i1.p1  ORF type:complete len:363 (+),score=34.14 TRINITY_DN2084_c0_g1_i1:71-1090(+)
MPIMRSLWRSSSSPQIHPQSHESQVARPQSRESQVARPQSRESQVAQPRGARLLTRVRSSVISRSVRVDDAPMVPPDRAAASSDLLPSLLGSTPASSPSNMTNRSGISLVPESDCDQVVFAAHLAKKYTVNRSETYRIVKAWDQFRSAHQDQFNQEHFGTFIGKVFDVEVEDVRCSVVEDAVRSSLRMNEPCIDDFMSWYMRNMFRDIKKIDEERSRSDRNLIESRIESECGIDALTIRGIRKAFDTYDQDKSGEIDFDEFKAMIIKLMKANEGDVSDNRIRHFWDEARGKESILSFYQFARWYGKNVFSQDSPHFVESLYDSYNPTRMRSKEAARGRS